jgi:signal transduction histidine kinase/CheY-like chemotaxis protein
LFSFNRRFSIEAGYNLFAFVITVIIILIFVKQAYDEVELKKSEQQALYLTEADKIAIILGESFDYVENFNRFLADKIAAFDEITEENISSILGYKSDRGLINIGVLTWILADFITPKGQVISASHVHQMQDKNFISPNKRHWMESVQATPWVLHLDRPDDGITSGEYIIPAGFGITSYNGKKFLGSLSTGLSVDKLSYTIIEHLDRPIKFIILNDKLDPIAFSDPKLRTLDFSKFKNIIQNTSSEEGEFSKSIILDNINFKYYKNIAKRGGFVALLGVSVIEDDIMLNHTLRNNLIYTIGVLLFFIASLYYFNKILLAPIRQLSENALAIAKGERLRYTPSIHTKDAAYLQDALDMVEDLLGRERAINTKLQSTTEQLQEANIVLEEKREQLEQSLKANTEFVNNVSHEVRTPIHGISTLSRGLIDNWKDLDDKDAYSLATKIASSAQRLLSMVSNLLDVSKLKYGEMNLSFQHVNINKLAIDMIEECRNLYVSDKSIKLNIKEYDQLEGFVDPDKITQVLRNLLSNAIKVSDRGTITIEIKRDGKFAQVSVTDEGVGIPEPELKLVFNAFAQSTRTKGKFSGVGLGLTISQKIIQAHGGEIWCENIKPYGAKFTFTVPVLDGTSITKKKTALNRKELLASTSKINLMVIDDEETCIMSVQMITHGSNYKLFSYKGPKEALDFLKSNPDLIDVVMIDMMMPQMDGLEVLKTINSNPKLAHIISIIQSGIADEKQINGAWDNGVTDFLRKPYTQEIFINSIEKSLKKKY